MKKFLKNAIISFLIIFFILSIINLVFQVIQHYFIVTPQIIELAESVKENGISAEESYQILSSVYAAGYGDKIQIQIMILLISVLLSVVIGLIFTFEEKSKFRIICYYILGMLVVALIPTLFNIFYYLEFSVVDFMDELFYYFKNTWVWYTLAFILFCIIKITISNKKTKELNEILYNKQKSN